MSTITFAEYKNLSIFNIKTLEKIFIMFSNGELEKGEFNIVEQVFTDGSSNIGFIYPTDFTVTQAYRMLDIIHSNISKIKLTDLIDNLPKE